MRRKTFKRLCYCDKFDYYDVDKVHDLEKFPYPFDDGVVDEIWLSHVLERMGQDPDVFNKIIKELYRICKNNALIYQFTTSTTWWLYNWPNTRQTSNCCGAQVV